MRNILHGLMYHAATMPLLDVEGQRTPTCALRCAFGHQAASGPGADPAPQLCLPAGVLLEREEAAPPGEGRRRVTEPGRVQP